MRSLSKWIGGTVLTLFLLGIANGEVSTKNVVNKYNHVIKVNQTLTIDDLNGNVESIDVHPINGEGKAALDGDIKIVTYTPAKNFLGNDFVGLSVKESDGKISKADINIKVEGTLEEVLSADQIGKIGLILFQALVMAIILELALHRIFDSRFYFMRFEGRGFKFPISLVAALCVLIPLKFDLVSKLLGTILPPAGHSIWPFWGYLLSALIISGGSSTVFRLYRKLGLRVPVGDLAGEEGAETGWTRISIQVVRGNVSDKPLNVLVGGFFHGTIPADKHRYPLKASSTEIVSFGDTEIEINEDGGKRWLVSRKLPKSRAVNVFVDLTQIKYEE